ncbi:response regulator [Maribacter sp. MMG018]|uniref:response regulator n=1 Tax=Maribacter sp. MMG018 TaxID=2822688 RepID=UPI001B38C2CB|nr:response regulator [Maribacter sp. MMG018]MBQ4914666.1 response regulator [Maribacter sp. MMG018]
MDKKSNVLLVDDDELYLYLMEKTIKEMTQDIEVNSFTDGEQAVEFVSKCTKEKKTLPKVIFLDINMPFLDGWGFLAEFKKLKSKIEQQINIYIVSSSVRESDIKKAAEYEELTDYMIKPIDRKKLAGIFTKAYNVT